MYALVHDGQGGLAPMERISAPDGVSTVFRPVPSNERRGILAQLMAELDVVCEHIVATTPRPTDDFVRKCRAPVAFLRQPAVGRHR